MAVIKAVSSHAPVNKAVHYITDPSKTELDLISGINCSPFTAISEMQATKELYGKTEGRTYKHFVQSFHADEKITAKEAFEIAKEFAEKSSLFQGFEVVFATHTDKDHIHTHFIVNSVSFEDGHKFQMKSSDLREMMELSDNLCKNRELSITEKGKTFKGEIREETVSYSKETYNRLKQAEQGNVKSFVFDIALKVLEAKESATSREEFVETLKHQGINVDWQDKHKYITFTDLDRQEAGERQCKVRDNKLEKYFNIDFSKEGLTHEFETNFQREKDRENRLERANANSNREQQIGIREQLAESNIDTAARGISEDEDRLSSVDGQVRRIIETVSSIVGRNENVEDCESRDADWGNGEKYIEQQQEVDRGFDYDL